MQNEFLIKESKNKNRTVNFFETIKRSGSKFYH